MQQNEIDRINRIIAVGVEGRTEDATLEELLGLTDIANGALGDLLGAFTNVENLKALLGDLDTTTPKQLGQILGGFDHIENLKAILGGYTAASPLKTGVDTIETDTEKIYDVTLGTDPVAGSLGSFIAGGGTALGTGLGASRSIVDAIGHTGLAFLATGLGSNFGDFQGRTNLKTLLLMLGLPDNADGSLYERLGPYTSAAPLKTSIDGVNGIFHEQDSVGIDIAVDNVGVDILDLNAANTRYIIRDMRLKLDADPSTETVTISLETLIDDVATVVDTFEIDTTNWGTYHSLMDMFGVPHIGGDDIHIFATYSVAGPITVKGQYSHAKTNV